MADSDEVTSPDQHKPTNVKAARIGAVLIAAIVVAMLFGYPLTDMERIWLIAIAGLLVLILVGDWLLRKNGLR